MIHKTRFSMIELLVVISVIAILAGLLLPALNSAREKGLAIQCTGIMKTLGQAGALYIADANGNLPPLHINGTELWYQSAGNALYFNYFLGTNTPNRKYVPVKNLCPKVSGYSNLFRTTNASFPGETFLSFYGMNAWEPLRFGDIRVHIPEKSLNPSGKLLHTETNNPSAAPNANEGKGLLSRDDAQPDTGKITYTHHNSANVLFFDGHVQSCNSRVLYDGAKFSKLWEAYKR